MYLYYQKHPGLTEFLISSDGRTNRLNWKSASDKKEAEFVIHTLKQVPVANRLMDDSTKIWSILGSSGDVLLTHFESFVTQGLFKYVKLTEITDNLQERLEKCQLNRPLVKTKVEEIKFKEDEFFYASTADNSSTLTRDQIICELTRMLDTEPAAFNALIKAIPDAAKSLYRKAALKYHPDRNNGDGSKMSELNMYWSLFNQGVSK